MDRAAAEVFDAVDGVRDWWIADVEGSNETVGDEFSYEVPGAHYCKLQVTELAPGRRIVWRVVDNRMSFVTDQSEWIGSELQFDLHPTARGTACASRTRVWCRSTSASRSAAPRGPTTSVRASVAC